RWAEIVKKILPKVIRYITHAYGEWLADSAARSALGRLVEAVQDDGLPNLDNDLEVELWLRKVARYRAIDRLRKEHLNDRATLTDMGLVPDSSQVSEQESVEFVEHIRAQFVVFETQSGDEDLNALLEARLEGLTLKEIAARHRWSETE